MGTDMLLIAGAILGASIIAVMVANLVMVQRGIDYEISEVPDLDSPAFERLLVGLVGVKLAAGNRVRLLLNGREAFPAMFEAVRGAKRSITFENYVYWSGKIGGHFADLLAEKSRAGVSVHVVLDWVGSFTMDRKSLRAMESAGVEVHRYHRPRFGGMHRLNHRTHRRELVVDGRIAFTGGVGFGDKWQGDGESSDSWRDNHYELQGPAVADVQAVFVDNWLKTSGDVLTGDSYYPKLESGGPHEAAVLRSAPTERTTSGRLLLLMLIAAAKHSVQIEQAYFVPDRQLREAMADAAKRGVDVEVLVPGEQIDYPFVRHASRANWGPMLEAGVRIYEYQPTMLHVKSMVVDERWVVVGSANIDFRSLYRNDEIYLVVRDREFAQQHRECFEADKAESEEITLERWRSRPVRQKLLERSVALLRTQL